MSDNVAVMEGYTLEVVADFGHMGFNLLVKPGTEYEGWFKAWDTDAQEWVRIAGWLATIEEVGGNYVGS